MEKSNSNSKLVSTDKKYKTRDGRSARIICTDMKACGYSVVALVQSEDGEQIESYTAEGLFWSRYDESKYDLIEVSPYEDWKVDDLIMVRDSDRDTWVMRYFAKVQDGKVYAWKNGYTSYTADGCQTHWSEARKPTVEELESIRSKV